jgi:hypothetical protein
MRLWVGLVRLDVWLGFRRVKNGGVGQVIGVDVKYGLMSIRI